jgi:tRNA A-37 threonylcarbamoyl transferase component Bud32
MLLAGIDITLKQEISHPHVIASVNKASPALICPHEDCGQTNPADSENCVYCNRSLGSTAHVTPTEPLQSLVNLPSALKKQYHIINAMPTRGAEAELLIVQATSDGPQRVAKIYRHGILPRREVQERIKKIPLEHRVEILDEGISDGHAYELMELCEHGSLREMMQSAPLAFDTLRNIVHELAIALTAVHNVGLVHRDLKPENILIRTHKPLDLVLTDFSISSILDMTQRFTGVARTLPYAAPESLSGVIDFKSDFWAMGMIILEACQGIHPFNGLSDAVVMHHLTTRNIDLTEVIDRNIRKLLLGLLQRDPNSRWGAVEIKRWLANDQTLAEPASLGSVLGFNEPYHVGIEICHKPEQLAVALARNWKDGLADISNGQLLAWFRDVQKDQNVVRLLIDMRGQASLSLHVQLLKLILQLAPGIPPVWQGETIELSTILTYANKALKGETEAAWWLDNLYKNQILEIYAHSGNRQSADLVQRWNHALDQFNQAWKKMLAVITEKSAANDPDTVADFDELMYGRKDLLRPSMVNMHARLLAMSFDNSWADRLRQRVTAESLALAIQCSWINELGDPLKMDAPSLLVLEALLPEAKKSVEFQLKKSERILQEMMRETNSLRDETLSLLASIGYMSTSSLPTQSVCENLREQLNEYFKLMNHIRASNRTDQDWQYFKKKASRPQITANIMMDTLDKLSQHRAITAGWLSAPVIISVVIGIFLIPAFLPGIRLWIIIASIALVVWRLLPDYWMMKSIQKLGAGF